MSSITLHKKIVTLNKRSDKYYFVTEKETFGQYVARNRDIARLSQRDLAQRIQKSSTYISYIERNYNPAAKDGKSHPSLDVVDRIARALGVNQDEARLAAGYAPAQREPSPNGLTADAFHRALEALGATAPMFHGGPSAIEALSDEEREELLEMVRDSLIGGVNAKTRRKQKKEG